MATLEEVQQIVDALLTGDLNRLGVSIKQRFFSIPEQQLLQSFHPFGKEDNILASQQVAEWQNLIEQKQGEQGLHLLYESIINALATHGTSFANHALMTFIVHHGAEIGLTLPHFLLRHPHLARRRSVRRVNSREDALNWFREDIFLNEHHEHWHTVYLEAPSKEQLKDRQGELFIYMHQQMLARYNTERLAAGLPTIEPFPNREFGEQIVEGYDPGLDEYGVRIPNTFLRANAQVNEKDIKTYNQRKTPSEPGSSSSTASPRGGG